MVNPEITKTYNLAAVSLTVGGRDISGYSEDGGIEWEEAADLYEDTTGSDGEDVSSRINNNTAFVNISLMETSNAYRLLAELMEEHLAANDAKLPIPTSPFQLSDPMTGDTASAAMVTFMTRPLMSKGATVGERVFRLKLSKPTRSWGALNLV